MEKEFDLYAFTTGFGSTKGLLDSDKTRLGTEFFDACSKGYLDEAKALLEKGADIDVERTDQTPLFMATQNNHRETAIWLLEQGAEANCRNLFGWSGLHQAVKSNDLELTQAYLSHGALATRQPQRTGETPLMVACKQGNKEIALTLLERGVNVKTVDKARNTALHYAAANGEAEICAELLSRGASVTMMNAEGKNCADVASNDMVRSQLEAHSLTEAIQTVAPEKAADEAPAAPVKRRILKA